MDRAPGAAFTWFGQQFRDRTEEARHRAAVWPAFRTRNARVFALALLVAAAGDAPVWLAGDATLAVVTTRSAVLATHLAAILFSWRGAAPGRVAGASLAAMLASVAAWAVPELAGQDASPALLFAAFLPILMAPGRPPAVATVLAAGVAAIVAVVALALFEGQGLVAALADGDAFFVVVAGASVAVARNIERSDRLRTAAERRLAEARTEVRVEHDRAERARTGLTDASGRFSEILRHLAPGVSVVDRDGRYVYWNDEFLEIFRLPPGFLSVGKTRDEVVGYLREQGYFGRRDMDEKAAAEFARPAQGQRFTVALPEGRYLEMQREALPDGGLVTTYIDVTERKRLENLLRDSAESDALTGLANRAGLTARLTEALHEAAAAPVHVGLLLLDLDRFKQINDTHGHPAGDAVLQAVAAVLRRTVRGSDTAARLGGDEFAVVLPRIASPHAATLLAERILAALRTPVRIGDHDLTVSASIGVAVHPEHGCDADALLAAADRALYGAKEAGRNAWWNTEEAPAVPRYRVA